MELDSDLLYIQGLFLTLQKSHRNLEKIKYKGGNEHTITVVVKEVQKFLLSNNYTKNTVPNPAFADQLKRIILFLVLNTELDSPITLPQYMHLTNVMPQISKCLLANVIVELNLTKHYTQVLEENFCLQTIEELLVEIVQVLKTSKPREFSYNAHVVLLLIITKLSNYPKSDTATDKIIDLVSLLLIQLTGIKGDQTNINKDSVYQQIGYNTFYLLDLLMQCDKTNPLLSRVIEKLLNTCSSVMMAVTLEVFCLWAEVRLENQVLQTAIATKAYMFIEKYQKHPPAKQLIGMLSTIAQKPKTIDELIQQADVPTMISMVHSADINQKRWFQALLNTEVLQNPETIKCISQWSHLATSGDVSRLLNLSVSCEDSEAKNVVIKCAAGLELSDLIVVTTRHLHQHGVDNVLTENVYRQMTFLFNKLKFGSGAKPEFDKEIYLRLLQNPGGTLGYIFCECIKYKFFTPYLKQFFASVKEVADINNVGYHTLKRAVDENMPVESNVENYIELFNVLLEAKFCSLEFLVLKYILPLMKTSVEIENNEQLKTTLEVLNSLNETNLYFKKETAEFFIIIFNIIEKYRCLFLDFDIVKQDTVKEAVGIAMKYCDASHDLPVPADAATLLDIKGNTLVSFYKRRLVDKGETQNILKFLCPSDDFKNLSQGVANLIKILPICVAQEWRMITSELVEVCGVEITTESLCDCMVLLCHLFKSQDSKTEEARIMHNAMKYCLQNFGIAIKDCVKPKLRCLEEDCNLSKHMCRLLRDIPNDLKLEEGLSLANLLSEESLKSLKEDKQFACSVASIGEPLICKVLGQKILS